MSDTLPTHNKSILRNGAPTTDRKLSNEGKIAGDDGQDEQVGTDPRTVKLRAPDLELQNSEPRSLAERINEALPVPFELNAQGVKRRKELWDRFCGKGRQYITWKQSAYALATHSVLNVFLVFIPIAWVGHFVHWAPSVVFTLCFLAIVPLVAIFDFGGEQLAMYTGGEVGDMIVVTLNNLVEAILAILLLTKCELKILQSTIVGVILLHLLLIPGTAFLSGGARVWEQDLHPHVTQLNHSLLTIGCLSILIPTAFFAALDRGGEAASAALLSDEVRGQFLKMSRGLAVILLCIYIASRIFLYDPPGEFTTVDHQATPEAWKKHEAHLAEATPSVNSFFLLFVLAITVALVAVTAEWLVDSIEFVREAGGITEEWFGLILLPVVSFSADGAVTIIYFVKRIFFIAAQPPEELAKAKAIDMSIQFSLFWMPFLVLLGWWTDKPFSLLFDFYELAVLLSACFLVNYVTADSKTNWVEGFSLLSFYFMIAICTWFYTGQPHIETLLECAVLAAGGEAAGAAVGAPAGEH